MTGPFFVDTNVPVYAGDECESEKQPQARAWLEFLWKTHKGRISMQVVQKYYQVMTRGLRPGLPSDVAREDIRDLMIWRPIAIDRQATEQAWWQKTVFSSRGGVPSSPAPPDNRHFRGTQINTFASAKPRLSAAEARVVAYGCRGRSCWRAAWKSDPSPEGQCDLLDWVLGFGVATKANWGIKRFARPNAGR